MDALRLSKSSLRAHVELFCSFDSCCLEDEGWLVFEVEGFLTVLFDLVVLALLALLGAVGWVLVLLLAVGIHFAL